MLCTGGEYTSRLLCCSGRGVWAYLIFHYNIVLCFENYLKAIKVKRYMRSTFTMHCWKQIVLPNQLKRYQQFIYYVLNIGYCISLTQVAPHFLSNHRTTHISMEWSKYHLNTHVEMDVVIILFSRPTSNCLHIHRWHINQHQFEWQPRYYIWHTSVKMKPNAL